MNKLLEELEKDLEKYCGDYGTLEGRLETTLYKILAILKEMNKDSDKKVNNFISFIDFTNMSEEKKYNLLNEKDEEIERLKQELEEETLNKEIAQGHRKNIQINEAYERKENTRLHSIIKEIRKCIEEEPLIEDHYDYEHSFLEDINENYYKKLKEILDKENK